VDPSKSRIPETLKTIHLIAVCGTAMGALACMLKEMGFTVTGSDRGVYPPMSTYLTERGIRINDGFRAGNLAHRPDLVVVGNAVTRDNPEAIELEKQGLNYCSMPQALNRFAAKGKKTVVVTGTHGKTTTSALVSWILSFSGLEPSFMVGGILKNFNSNYRLGNGHYMVLEGDEYDTAFFDKGPKFMHFNPKVAILTSIEFDHADIFTDLDHVKRAFGGFMAAMPVESTLVACDGDRNIDELVPFCRCQVERYGAGVGPFWRIGKISVKPPWTDFEVFREDKVYGTFRTRMMGKHNLSNILSAIGALDHLSVPASVIGKALENFEGVKRRQEVRGVGNGVTVLDDFAHHPTAVRETLRAVRPFFPKGRLVGVFEPRTNTSMRDVFQDLYPEVFDPADMVCIRKPPLLSKIPENERFSSEQLVADLKSRGKDAYFFEETDGIIRFLTRTVRPGDAILVMSNGGFDNIHERLLESL